MWGLGAALYFIGFYQRVAPAVMTVELSDAFGLSAAALGNLSAFYFYSYVAMQIPTGLLADRYGPRLLLAVGGAVAGIGTAVFAAAPDTYTANLGRLLIGGSVGVAFVSMLKLASHWMPVRQFALASAMALVVGVCGAVFAGVPLRILVDEFGWRSVMWASAAATMLLSIFTWLTLRDDPIARGYSSYAAHTHDTNQPGDGVVKGLKDALGALLRLSAAVPFEAPDGKPVSLVFALLVPEQGTERHLQILSELAQMFSDRALREAMAAAADAAALHQIISAWQPDAAGQRRAVA